MSEEAKGAVIILGATSPETAHVVEDYPFGFTLRCRIRFWTETATRGAAKGRQRFMSQTTNPKKPGEFWNKPKASTYSDMVVLYTDAEKGHVHHYGLHAGQGPEAFAIFLATGLYEQFDEAHKKQYKVVEYGSRYFNRRSWADWHYRASAICTAMAGAGGDADKAYATVEKLELPDGDRMRLAFAYRPTFDAIANLWKHSLELLTMMGNLSMADAKLIEDHKLKIAAGTQVA
jgi:hypothetical protein